MPPKASPACCRMCTKTMDAEGALPVVAYAVGTMTPEVLSCLKTYRDTLGKQFRAVCLVCIAEDALQLH
jgi:hypothetical protein